MMTIIGEVPTHIPTLKKGEWVFSADMIGRVISVDTDPICKEEVMTLRMYDRNGYRGKREPMVPQEGWSVIEKPEFPLRRFEYLENLVKVVREL